MMKKPQHLFISLAFAFLAAGVTLIVAQAHSPQPAQPALRGFTGIQNTMTNENCINCHKDISASWMTGAHGNAGTDPIFLDAWNIQGKPGACLVCHTTGYDPATHLGGCAYLFVRGFPTQGVWFEAPAPAAITALDALFAEASP